MIEIFPWFILFMPLVAALSIVLFTRRDAEMSGRLSIGAVVAGFWLCAIQMLDPHVGEKTRELVVNWLSVGDFQIDLGLLLDRLSLIMILGVTTVGGAIHIYSYEYMRGDSSFTRYFASLSFFTFSMLGLVLANNFLMMFIFWELVGVSSYMLIGFWHEKPAAADAGKKAFLVNRLGDTGFLLGILILWAALGTLNFGEMQAKLTANPTALGGLATVAGLLIFCGAMGKSAQFPLHVWLPDAMEGPTPVSALIHAATMVAAGVYMLCRVFFLFTVVPEMPAALSFLNGLTALNVISWIGGITALLAALMAVQQNDIKRILAYSTLSQLGYMVMAVGLNGPDSAMYHLGTHAAFKALLFLGAGSVILALHHEQDIWKMGNLSGKMPITFWCFLAATLALCGVPPFSGFYSKDAILAQAWHESPLLFLVAAFVAMLTAFYMFRLMYVAFWGKSRSTGAEHAHEAPPVMHLPMLFLVVPTVLAGFWGWDSYLGQHFGMAHAEGLPWYKQIIAPLEHAPLAAFAGLLAAGIGWFAAAALYSNATKDPLPERLGSLAIWMRDRFYFDELYEKVFIRLHDTLAMLVAGIDRFIVSGVCVRGAHGTAEFVGRVMRLAQTGNLQTYACMLVLGVILVLYFAMK